MKIWFASFSKGQMKIQQMAFVLVAVSILFIIGGLFYLSVRINELKESASALRDDEVREIIRKIASSPELSSPIKTCISCIDFEKAVALKDFKDYEKLLNFDYLAIEKVYPRGKGECTKTNFPDCGTITLINKTKDFGKITDAYVSICRWDFDKDSYYKCEIGRILASSHEIE